MSANADYVLETIDDRLQYRATHKGAPGALYVDFVEGALAHRVKQSGKRNEFIARAVGVKPNQAPLRVLDATAGLGRDAFVLATLGCKVTLCESSPVVAALLEDGLRRARQCETLQAVMDNVHYVGGDAIAHMQSVVEPYDVVYLDPMFPEKNKSALVKKDMQLLQAIVGATENGETLFQAAKACAAKRVVVKRHRLSTPLVAAAPSHHIVGKSSRFDVYMV